MTVGFLPWKKGPLLSDCPPHLNLNSQGSHGIWRYLHTHTHTLRKKKEREQENRKWPECWKLMSVILATWKAEIRRLEV
jgi:hypothetical protein